MDGMLSQDEINALLNGMDLPEGDGDAEEVSVGAGETITEVSSSEPSAGSAAQAAGVEPEILTDVEKDAIGEVANISMGSSATTLYSLVNRKVNITTPVVTPAKWENLLAEYERPCVFIQIKYTMGLDGTNILVLKEHDVKVITDLMMGGDGTNTDNELGELHLSAISEAMNQMCGSIATSMASLLGKPTDIGYPLINSKVKKSFEIPDELCNGADIVKVTLRLIVDDLIDSALIQLYPISIVKQILKQEDV